MAEPLRSIAIAGSAVPILNRSCQRRRTERPRIPALRAMRSTCGDRDFRRFQLMIAQDLLARQVHSAMPRRDDKGVEQQGSGIVAAVERARRWSIVHSAPSSRQHHACLILPTRPALTGRAQETPFDTADARRCADRTAVNGFAAEAGRQTEPQRERPASPQLRMHLPPSNTVFYLPLCGRLAQYPRL